jgi:hypothetical protein
MISSQLRRRLRRCCLSTEVLSEIPQGCTVQLVLQRGPADSLPCSSCYMVVYHWSDMKIGALEWIHVSGYAAIIAGQGLVEKTDLSLVRYCPIPGYINVLTPDVHISPQGTHMCTCVPFEFKLDHSISQSSSQQ